MSTKHARIEMRATTSQKALLQRAADLSGRTLSEFVLKSAEEAAEDLVKNHQVISLSVADSYAFVEALINPPAPNEKLRAKIAQYEKEVFEEW